jgi:DNA-binding Lrp family transcriptional regulator
MSIQAVAAAIEIEDLAPATKLVLMLLANAMNGHTGQCNPDQERLAKEASMSVRSLRDHLASLERKGLIARDTVYLGRGRGAETHFRLLFLDRQDLPVQTMERQTSVNRPAKLRTMERQVVAAVDKDEPERNRKEPEDTSPEVNQQDVAKLALETIWAKWSKTGKERVQTNKGQCLKLLRKIGKTQDLREVTRAALRYARTTDPDFHQGLDTWLKNGRYENFLPPKASLPTLAPQPELSDLERAFAYFAKTGEWIGDRYGHQFPPTHPNASYPTELYARFGVAQPAERSAA